MKKGLIIFAIALAVGLGTVLIFGRSAEGGFMAFGHRGPGGPGFGGRGFDRIAEKLGLSDEQKAQAKQVLDDAKSRMEPIGAQLRDNHEAISKLGRDGQFNEAEVNRLADAQAAATKQLILEKESTKARLFAILTPEQRAKAGELLDRFGNGPGRGFGGGKFRRERFGDE